MKKQTLSQRIKRSFIVATAAVALMAMATPAHALINIPGEEITSKKPGASRDSSHVIAIGTKKHVDPTLSIQAQINAVNAQGGAAILPHPRYEAGGRAPGFSDSRLKSFKGHIGVELTDLMTDVNYSGRYWGWDYGAGTSPLVAQILGLKNGTPHNVWGFRNPDTDKLGEDTLRSSTVVRAAGLTQSLIMDALKRGDFMAIRAKHGASAAKKKSFPVPVVDFAKGTITLTAKPGYSIRMFRSDSNTPLTGTCSYTTAYEPVSRADDACAHDRYGHRFVYKVKGNETFVKVVVVNYADKYNLTNAQYQPILVSKAGFITSSPYADPTNPAISMYVGATHIHTRRSPDNPKGASPAATFRWFTKKGYDWVALTDHNRVSTDVINPKPAAAKNVKVAKGSKVKFSFIVHDDSTSKVTIKIKNSRGKVVKTLSAGWKAPHKYVAKSVKVDLAKGSYRYGVTATDSSLNKASYTSWKYLTVK